MPEEMNEDAMNLVIRATRAVEYGLIPLMVIEPTIGTAMVALATPGLLYNTIQIRRNRRLTDGSQRAVCLVAERPGLEYTSIMTGKKGQIAGLFTQYGIRVDFKHGARRRDLLAALKDHAYQHIAVVGHGSGDCWEAKDGVVTSEDLDYIMEKHQLPRKTGYFVKVTCGTQSSNPLGKSVVEDPSKVLGYTTIQGIGDTLLNLRKPNIGLEPLLG